MKVTTPIAALSCLLLLAACKNDQPLTDSTGVPPGYELVWSDEFDYGSMPNPENWGYQTGGFGWTAKEKQYYQEADPDNVSVEDGLLNITARIERVERNGYTSTRLVSKNKAQFKYGYIEVRAKPAAGSGLRSSFWLVGSNVKSVGWPNAGEIDIFEHYGEFPSVVSAAIQTKDDYWAGQGQLGKSLQRDDIEDEFHVYGCHWTENSLTFSFDGEPYWTYEKPAGRYEDGWPFVREFYMAATLSVGGQRGPNAKVDNTAFPATYSIDYVRVYQSPH